jgi:hypothetical protein
LVTGSKSNEFLLLLRNQNYANDCKGADIEKIMTSKGGYGTLYALMNDYGDIIQANVPMALPQ